MAADAWWGVFDEYAAAAGLPLTDERLTIVYRARRAGLSPSAAVQALQALEVANADTRF